jgi:hypothetical protein
MAHLTGRLRGRTSLRLRLSRRARDRFRRRITGSPLGKLGRLIGNLLPTGAASMGGTVPGRHTGRLPRGIIH